MYRRCGMVAVSESIRHLLLLLHSTSLHQSERLWLFLHSMTSSRQYSVKCIVQAPIKWGTLGWAMLHTLVLFQNSGNNIFYYFNCVFLNLKKYIHNVFCQHILNVRTSTTLVSTLKCHCRQWWFLQKYFLLHVRFWRLNLTLDNFSLFLKIKGTNLQKLFYKLNKTCCTRFCCLFVNAFVCSYVCLCVRQCV